MVTLHLALTTVYAATGEFAESAVSIWFVWARKEADQADQLCDGINDDAAYFLFK